MSYRDRYIDRKDYKKLLHYYEMLLFNNHAFFVGLNLYENVNIKRIDRVEFPKYEDSEFVSIDMLKRLDCAVSELEVEDYKIRQIENKIIHRFLTDFKYTASDSTMKTSKVKSMLIGIVMYVRSLF